MARARKAASAKSNDSATGDRALTCPECGKTFARPASLGAHRNRAHGVAGASNRAQRTRARKGSPKSSTTRSKAAQTPTRQTNRRPRNANASGDGLSSGINRDALLQALFPNGLPAREAVIRRTNAWLDEAEQLARTR